MTETRDHVTNLLIDLYRTSQECKQLASEQQAERLLAKLDERQMFINRLDELGNWTTGVEDEKLREAYANLLEKIRVLNEEIMLTMEQNRLALANQLVNVRQGQAALQGYHVDSSMQRVDDQA